MPLEILGVILGVKTVNIVGIVSKETGAASVGN